MVRLGRVSPQADDGSWVTNDSTAQDLEGVERLHEVGVGSGFVGQERVDLSVEEEGDRPRLDIAHLLTLPHREACGNAAHVADLEVEQHQARIDLHDGWHDVDARPHTVQEMAPATAASTSSARASESVARRMSVTPGWYTAAPVGPRSGDAEEGVSRSSERGYHAAVLEIRVDRPEGADYAQLSPEGELDAYSVAAFREAFAELGEEARLIVNLGGVQFMDSAGLGALIGGIRKVRENDGVIAVFCDRANITRLLHTTGFDRIVPVCEDLPSAVASLDEPQS